MQKELREETPNQLIEQNSVTSGSLKLSLASWPISLYCSGRCPFITASLQQSGHSVATGFPILVPGRIICFKWRLPGSIPDILAFSTLPLVVCFSEVVIHDASWYRVGVPFHFESCVFGQISTNLTFHFYYEKKWAYFVPLEKYNYYYIKILSMFFQTTITAISFPQLRIVLWRFSGSVS